MPPLTKSRAKTADSEKWLSLADAALLMGVHPATLRAWADRGHLASQRTAGGHRRFKRADLDAWMASHRAGDAGAQVLAQTALGRLRLEMERADAPWLEGHDEETRRAHRELGRRLMQEIVRVASASEINEPVRNAAESIGREYAALSMRRSLSLREAVRAFLFFRDNLVDALVQMAGALEPIAAPSWQSVHHRLSAFLNEVLIALIQVYEEHRREPSG